MASKKVLLAYRVDGETLHKLYLPEPLTKYVSVFAHSR